MIIFANVIIHIILNKHEKTEEEKTFEFVNVCDDNKTVFGCNTIAVLYDFKAQKYIAVKVDDEKFNKVETIILPNQ